MLIRQIQDTMLAAAPMADLLIVDFYEDKTTWHIAADSKSEIFCEVDEKRQVLVLSMPLLRPVQMDQQLLEIALQYSHAWDACDGLRVTLEGTSGPFWLVLDIGINGLDATTLAELIRNFVAKGATWREIIQQPPQEKTDEVAILSEEGMLRV